MLRVAHHGSEIGFSYDDLLDYASRSNVVAAALCYRLLHWMFSGLSPGAPPERARIVFRVAFDGPGIIDCLGLVTGAKSDHRIHFDPRCAEPDAPLAPVGRFYFEATYGQWSCSAFPNPSIFPRGFVDRIRRSQDGSGTEAEQSAFRHMKQAFAARILNTPVGGLFYTRVWPERADVVHVG